MVSIEHMFFGLSFGLSFSLLMEKVNVTKHQIIGTCLLGAIAPDIDWITIFFDKETYFGFKWYSHHSFSHSIIGCLFLGLAFFFLYMGLEKLNICKYINKKTISILIALFVFECLLHVFCDMVTIPGIWEGIPVFAPFSWKRYGGWSFMPWRSYLTIYLAVGSFMTFFFISFIETKMKISKYVLPSVALVLLTFGGYNVLNSKYISQEQWEMKERKLVGDNLYDFTRRLENLSYNYFKIDINYGH